MPEPTIPVLRVEGTHREVGRQIGEATAVAVTSRLERIRPGTLAAAEPYRQATLEVWPWLVEELDGVAEGCGADPRAVFAASIEEIAELYGDGEEEGRCSDLVAAPPATVDGHLWVAHNNDLPPECEDELIAIERHVPGDPVVFTVGIGPWLSVGFSDAGLALTGNEVTPNDNRVGIPRLVQVREILRRRTLADAVDAALHPRRASSYNNVLSHRTDGAVSVEGSATDAELLRPDSTGALAHTNHYVSERMRPYEGDVPYAARSAVRYRAALRWLAPGGRHGRPAAGRALRPHRRARLDLPAPRARSTVEDHLLVHCGRHRRKLVYGRGNPCNSTEQRHRFG